MEDACYTYSVIRVSPSGNFVAVDILRAIGSKDPVRHLRYFKKQYELIFVDDDHRWGAGRPPQMLDIAGAQKLLSAQLRGRRYREVKSLADSMGIEISPLTLPEPETIRIISAAFADLDPIAGMKVENYVIDLYLKGVDIAIECDELGHEDRCDEHESERQAKLTHTLNCQWVRFNPHEESFNVGKVIQEIRLLIS